MGTSTTNEIRINNYLAAKYGRRPITRDNKIAACSLICLCARVPPFIQNNNRGGYNAGDTDDQQGFNQEEEIYYMVSTLCLKIF